jgi:hypothetical protein
MSMADDSAVFLLRGNQVFYILPAKCVKSIDSAFRFLLDQLQLVPSGGDSGPQGPARTAKD